TGYGKDGLPAPPVFNPSREKSAAFWLSLSEISNRDRHFRQVGPIVVAKTQHSALQQSTFRIRQLVN
ncbi:MAG: hypothetical protein OEV81_14360, partial [Betaproteobacteria bacterium]|nr:hypothetical protein [Betaproteobacteria bacterium]